MFQFKLIIVCATSVDGLWQAGRVQATEAGGRGVATKAAQLLIMVTKIFSPCRWRRRQLVLCLSVSRSLSLCLWLCLSLSPCPLLSVSC